MSIKHREYRELKRIEKAFKNYLPIMFATLSMAGLYTLLAIMIWQATAGMPNAIDGDDGLPKIYDLFLVLSVLLIWITSITICKSILNWKPKKFKQSKSAWTDKIPKKNDPLHPALNNKKNRMPGPPASNHAD